MKINRQVIQSIVGFLCILLLLAPITVQAQTKVVVIPLFGDDPKPLKNIITVAKANGDFRDPVAAVNSISDASAENPYLVVIGPGVYTITQTLQMKSYVDIVGSGENVTKITGAISTASQDASSAIISGVSNSALSSLTVENTGGGACSIGLCNNNASPSVSHATLTASGGTNNRGVYNSSSSPMMNNVTVTASGGSYSFGVYNSSSSPTMNNVTVTASSESYSCGVYNIFSSSPILSNVTVTASEGGNSFGVYNHSSSSPTMNNVTVTAWGGTNNHGVYNYSSSSPTMSNVTVTASGGTDSYGLYNYSSSPTMNNVTVTAWGGNSNYCVRNSGSSFPAIRRSTMDGGSGSYSLHSANGTASLSQSTLKGPVSGGTNNQCVACDDGSGKALDANCK